jgi:hypothetical protein
VYQSLRELVTDKYETTQKFVRKMDDQHVKRILQKNMTFDEARKITEEDYIQYTERVPFDTAGIMQRFIREFSMQVQLPASNKRHRSGTNDLRCVFPFMIKISSPWFVLLSRWTN